LQYVEGFKIAFGLEKVTTNHVELMKATSHEEVIEALKTTHVNVEQDRSWLWVTSPETAPVHKIKGGCKCEECQQRAQLRETLKSIGFKFAFREHPLPSGKFSRWGHNCGKAISFRKRKQTASGDAPHRAEAEDDLSEAEAFFAQA